MYYLYDFLDHKLKEWDRKNKEKCFTGYFKWSTKPQFKMSNLTQTLDDGVWIWSLYVENGMV